MLSIMLKNYRRTFNRSQESIARQCKLEPRTIRAYEGRLRQPTLEDIETLCEGLGWSHTIKVQLMEWLSSGGIYRRQHNRKVLNDEAMRLIQKMEKKYGSLTKTSDDDPDLFTVRAIVGVSKGDYMYD